MKTFFRIIGRIIGNLTYYLTAILTALILTVSLFGYIGYHYYTGYYQTYMDVQESWASVDNSYVEYINTVEDNLDMIEVLVKNKEYESEEQKEIMLSKVGILKENLKGSVFALSYKEKFASYPALVNSTKDVVNNLSSEEEQFIEMKNMLSQIEKEINDNTSKYNQTAKEFNMNNEKFPENVIAELGSFQTWEEL